MEMEGELGEPLPRLAVLGDKPSMYLCRLPGWVFDL